MSINLWFCCIMYIVVYGIVFNGTIMTESSPSPLLIWRLKFWIRLKQLETLLNLLWTISLFHVIKLRDWNFWGLFFNKHIFIENKSKRRQELRMNWLISYCLCFYCSFKTFNKTPSQKLAALINLWENGNISFFPFPGACNRRQL